MTLRTENETDTSVCGTAGAIHGFRCRREDLPEAFPAPFRYVPCPGVIRASEEVIRHIGSDPWLRQALSEGKMLGVLIVRIPGAAATPDSSGAESPSEYAFLAAFSGNVGGRNIIPYFVPPIFDLLSPDGHFKKEEARISDLNRQIEEMSASPMLAEAEKTLASLREERAAAVSAWKERMSISKVRRDRIRNRIAHCEDAGSDDLAFYDAGLPVLDALDRESRFEKAELRRLAAGYDMRIAAASETVATHRSGLQVLMQRRKDMSDNLQKWIFDNFIVRNALGESRSISDIFSAKGLVPPGGTGECAAPKLLQYAYMHGLEPVAMGEFWYGARLASELREHGRFYPSCTSKCGPLLKFMTAGLEMQGHQMAGPAAVPAILFEDEALTVVEKPSGMPSVPGKSGGKSLAEMLEETGRRIYPVHRLDMDTSGLMVFARTEEAGKMLQGEFAGRNVRKTYIAALDTGHQGKEGRIRRHTAGEKGVISIPVAPDYLNRPRQAADTANGKEAVTEYEIIAVSEARTFVRFRPLTGRTHQLRIHSAHPDGLGAPIAGDRLYGSPESSPALCLCASEIEFIHPCSGERMRFALDETAILQNFGLDCK